MLMAAEDSGKKNALYALGSRDVRDETLKTVREIADMLQRGYTPHAIGRALESMVRRAVNNERRELAALVRELDLETDHVEIAAACSRLGTSGAARVAIDVTRKAVVTLVTERIGG